VKIYCCGCQNHVEARLTDGGEIYPHRQDLANLPFWQCGACGNYVGCHYKTKNRTAPLGCIPTPELKTARQHIHALLDPLWRSGSISRKDLYAEISAKLGRKYHTANLRSVDEAREVYKIIKEYCKGMQST